jgi:hypothetical protein
VAKNVGAAIIRIAQAPDSKCVEKQRGPAVQLAENQPTDYRRPACTIKIRIAGPALR